MNVTRDLALLALKKADWFGLSWGCKGPDGVVRLSAPGWLLVLARGPGALEYRDELLFPTVEHLSEAINIVSQVANWAESFGFIKRDHFDILLSDEYVFNQREVSEKARQKGG